VTLYGLDPNQVGPGALGFLVVAGIGFALYLLIKSMNKQISKIQVPREADIARENQPANHGTGDNSTKPAEQGEPKKKG
jgi:hypothetical protein